MKNIAGEPHFLVTTFEDESYIERVSLVLLDDDGTLIGNKAIPGDNVSFDRILLIEPISTDESTVYQYPQQLMDEEESAALVLVFLNNNAAMASLQRVGSRRQSNLQRIEVPIEFEVSERDNINKQQVVEWLQRAGNIKEYLSAVIK